MTEIKKGTPVWVWDERPENKKKAIYLLYDQEAPFNSNHVARPISGCACSWKFAEPINETTDKALQMIAEAKEKIAEAEKLLNAL